jgi:hypothetical protein
VDSEINVKPMEVLPSLLMAATLVAYFMTVSLAKFRNTKAAAMIIKLMMKSILNKSAKSFASKRFLGFAKDYVNLRIILPFLGYLIRICLCISDNASLSCPLCASMQTMHTNLKRRHLKYF